MNRSQQQRQARDARNNALPEGSLKLEKIARAKAADAAKDHIDAMIAGTATPANPAQARQLAEYHRRVALYPEWPWWAKSQRDGWAKGAALWASWRVGQQFKNGGGK